MRNNLFADTSQMQRPSFRPVHIYDDLTENIMVRIVSIDGIEIERAMQEGFIRVIPVDVLPGNRARRPIVLLTRSIFGN